MKKSLLLGIFALLSVSVVYAQSLVVTPAEGSISSISTITFSVSDNSVIMPSSMDADITLTDEDGDLITTITQDELTNAPMDFDEQYMPIAIKITLANEISAEGTYTLNVPASAFYVGEEMTDNAAMTVVWTISATSIAETKNTADDAIWYNILGQRVPKGTKGLVIINNKKCIVK